jgi:menaquinone-9 beta-reductase
LEALVSLDATLSPEAAARRLWDVAVIGAGPAGSLAARELARRGASVLLVDRAKFPRYKVCGGCLNPRAIRQLQKAGLGKLAGDLGAIPLRKLRVGAAGRFADVSLPTGAGVSREVFDAALIAAAIAAGVEFLPATTATVSPLKASADRRALRLRESGKDVAVEARIVLSAGGLGSKMEEGDEGEPELARTWTPGSRVGAGVMLPTPGPEYERGTIYMACGSEGYVGQVVVEDGRVDVAAALDPLAAKRAGGTGELAAAILRRSGLPSHPDLARLPWKGTPHLTRQAPRLGSERLFVLGDAAGYVEPFTGEGMAWALSGARLVAPLVQRGIERWEPELLLRWRDAYRRGVARRQFVCRLTAELLRRSLATKVMIRSLAIAPWLSRPFLQMMYRD